VEEGHDLFAETVLPGYLSVQLSRAAWQSFPEIDSVEFVDYLHQSIKDSFYSHSSPVSHIKG